MEARGKERDVPVSQCEALSSDLQTGSDLAVRPYLGKWGRGTPRIHFGGQACDLSLPRTLDIDLSGSNCSADQKPGSSRNRGTVNVLCLNV